MFRHRGVILRELQNKGVKAQDVSLGITLPVLKYLKC
jgi:hypothetical protein